MTGELHTIDVEWRDGVAIATVHGEIDASNAPLARASLTVLNAQTLVLDISDVHYLDSAGIAMLEVVRRGTDLRLVLAKGSTIERALEITGMLQLIATYASPDEALNAGDA